MPQTGNGPSNYLGVAPLRQWLALAVMWGSAAARWRLTTCLSKRKMSSCISALPNLIRILGTPITLVLMYCARKEQCGNVGDVLTHQKRFLVPPDVTLYDCHPVSENHLFLQLKDPSLTFPSGTHWVMPTPSTLVLQGTNARMTPW